MRKQLFLLLLVSVVTAAGVYGQGRRSVWLGVYTAAQADRGKAVYERTCIRCHAANLEGVADANLLGDFGPRFSLKGTDFIERWREDTAQNLYNTVYSGMPPRNEPGRDTKAEALSTKESIDVITYLFQGNDFPTGNRELEEADLPLVRIQMREGARPLPSFSTIQAVGCLTQLKPGVWQLSQGSEPIRVREFKAPDEQEIKAALDEPLGDLEFDLQSIGYVGPEFRPIEHQNHKMLVKGILIRQPPSVRIDVRALVDIASSCNQ